MENKDVKSIRFSRFPATFPNEINTPAVKTPYSTNTAIDHFIDNTGRDLIWAKIMAKVEMIPECGCWIWTGACNKDGYGHIKIRGIQFDTHRLCWRLLHGPIPKGMHILHRCDTPSCVNPYHLSTGSHRENMLDMHKKKRWGETRRKREEFWRLLEESKRAAVT